MAKEKICLISPEGKKRLGLILKASRDAKEWSIEDLTDEIERSTGHKIGRSTISSLERGHSAPSWNTLVLLESAKYICFPNSSQLLTASTMLEIASERIIP